MGGPGGVGRVGGVVRPDELVGPALLLTVGPAASGKSTLLGRLVAAGVVDEVVSTDVVRAEFGLAADDTETAYRVARRRARAALATGRVVAVDATNVRSRDRAAWLAVAVGSGATPVAIRVGTDLDLDQLVARDAGRQRHVPHDVIADQLALARASTPAVLAAEGFAIAEPGAVVDPAAASAA